MKKVILAIKMPENPEDEEMELLHKYLSINQ